MANGQGRTSGPPQRPGPQGPGPKPRRSFWKGLIYWTAVAGIWGLIALIAVFAVFATDLPDTSKIFDVKRQPSISYLDRSSGQISRAWRSQYSPPGDLDQLKPYVPAAFISIEDQRFYHHFGFDPDRHRSLRLSPTCARAMRSRAPRPSPSSSPAICS